LFIESPKKLKSVKKNIHFSLHDTFLIFHEASKNFDYSKNKSSSYTRPIHSNSSLPENGQIRAVKFCPNIFGRISFDLGDFRPMSSQKFADLGEIHPNRQNFARNFLGEI
jgi:hypothetical protein